MSIRAPSAPASTVPSGGPTMEKAGEASSTVTAYSNASGTDDRSARLRSAASPRAHAPKLRRRGTARVDMTGYACSGTRSGASPSSLSTVRVS